MAFYEKGPVRIHYEDVGSGFPLLLIAGGGLNSTISGLKRGDPFDEFFGLHAMCDEGLYGDEPQSMLVGKRP